LAQTNRHDPPRLFGERGELQSSFAGAQESSTPCKSFDSLAIGLLSALQVLDLDYAVRLPALDEPRSLDRRLSCSKRRIPFSLRGIYRYLKEFDR
jgi:hypothetical protein